MARRRPEDRKQPVDRQSDTLPHVDSGRIDAAGDAQDDVTASDYERELDRLDAAAHTERAGR